MPAKNKNPLSAGGKSKLFRPKRDEITFDAKSAKIYIGQQMYITLEKFFTHDFEQFFNDLTASQKITIMNMFFNTYFPKEVKVEDVDPFDDWSTEELKAYSERGEKPKGKIIYTVK